MRKDTTFVTDKNGNISVEKMNRGIYLLVVKDTTRYLTKKIIIQNEY